MKKITIVYGWFAFCVTHALYGMLFTDDVRIHQFRSIYMLPFVITIIIMMAVAVLTFCALDREYKKIK